VFLHRERLTSPFQQNFSFSHCAAQRGVITMQLNRDFDVPHAFRISDRKSAAKAVALPSARTVEMALFTLITLVTLVLLSGAVWTHAT